MIPTSLLVLALSAPASPAAGTPRGLYVEARTAAVYAGACHFGSQYTTQGREAVLGWRIDAGAWEGVDLAGVSLVVVLAAPENLDEPRGEGAAPRRAVVHLDAGASEEARRASRAWLEARHGGLWDELAGVRVSDLEVARDGERYAVRAGGEALAEGTLLPDRACCTMPFGRWYEPLVPVEGAVVGRSARFRHADPLLGRTWSRSDENDAFVARFGPARAAS